MVTGLGRRSARRAAFMRARLAACSASAKRFARSNSLSTLSKPTDIDSSIPGKVDAPAPVSCEYWAILPSMALWCVPLMDWPMYDAVVRNRGEWGRLEGAGGVKGRVHRRVCNEEGVTVTVTVTVTMTMTMTVAVSVSMSYHLINDCPCSYRRRRRLSACLRLLTRLGRRSRRRHPLPCPQPTLGSYRKSPRTPG